MMVGLPQWRGRVLLLLLLLIASAAARPEVEEDEVSVAPAIGYGSGLLTTLRAASPVPLLSFDITTTCPLLKGLTAAFYKKTCKGIGLGQQATLDAYRNICLRPSEGGVGTQQAEPPTRNTNGSPAPAPLERRVFGVPDRFKGLDLSLLLNREGGTYAFLWQATLNLYLLNSCCKTFCSGNLTQYLTPAGWAPVGGELGFDGVLFLEQQPTFAPRDPQLPYVATFRRGGALVIVVRGTASRLEWVTNFAYNLVDGPTFNISGGATKKVVGRVHAGFRDLFNSVWPRLLPAVDAAGVTQVFVTGHSQGANVAALVAYAASELLAQKDVAGRTTDLVMFGVPQGGDRAFVKAVASRVAVRSISFEADPVSLLPCPGSELTFTANMPACGAPPALVSTLTPPENIPYISQFRPHKGVITVTSALLPLQFKRQWDQVRYWTTSTAERNVIAAHVCALTCLTATNSQGFASPNRCRLTGDAAPDARNNTPCISPGLAALLGV